MGAGLTFLAAARAMRGQIVRRAIADIFWLLKILEQIIKKLNKNSGSKCKRSRVFKLVRLGLKV